MKWKKLGKIFEPDGRIAWMRTHAAVPIADQLSDNLYKLYFTSRDDQSRSHLSAIVVDINNPFEHKELATEPLLRPGQLGTFDDSGVMATSLVQVGQKKYLYYIKYKSAGKSNKKN